MKYGRRTIAGYISAGVTDSAAPDSTTSAKMPRMATKPIVPPMRRRRTNVRCQELRRAFPEPTVYRRAKELLIVGEDQEQFVRVRVEQASKLIEKMRAALKEHEADNGS
jgi:hypothetical protein